MWQPWIDPVYSYSYLCSLHFSFSKMIKQLFFHNLTTLDQVVYWLLNRCSFQFSFCSNLVEVNSVKCSCVYCADSNMQEYSVQQYHVISISWETKTESSCKQWYCERFSKRRKYSGSRAFVKMVTEIVKSGLFVTLRHYCRPGNNDIFRTIEENPTINYTCCR